MIPTKLFLAAVAVSTLVCSTTFTQQTPEIPGPEPEHQWLQKFVGEWTTNAKASMGPDQPPMECGGTIESRMIGKFWVVNELESTPQGMPMRSIQTIGYDPAKKKYVGTWVDSMMNHLWIYGGTVDESGTKLTLEAEGPNFMSHGKLTRFRDAYEFKTPDHIVFSSSILGENGKWTTFMTGDSVRKTGAKE